MNIGKRIKERRVELGLSQAELGKRLGISKGAISSVETGKERLTLDRLARYADALSLSREELIGTDYKSPDRIFLEYIKSLGCEFVWEDPEHSPAVFYGDERFFAKYDSFLALKDKIDDFATTAIRSMLIGLDNF